MNHKNSFLTLLALVAAGLTMRPLLTSVSTLLPQLRSDLQLNDLISSLLPALPMMMMGAVALIAGNLLHRHAARTLLLSGLSLLLLATALRYSVGPGWMLLLTACLGGAGIGLVQMTMPGAIRLRFPGRIAAVTGLWSGALMGGGGLGAAATPWIAARWGLAAGLTSATLLVMLALLLWLAVRLPAVDYAAASSAAAAPTLRAHRFPRAWSLALSFGLVNGCYASLISWLPQNYARLGWTSQTSGTLLAVMIAAQVAGALLMPLLTRGQDRRHLLLFCLLLQAAGLSGFLFAPLLAPWIWALIAGCGLGGAFPLALVLALDHLPAPQQGARLVAFVQGLGFMIAGAMPFIAGQLASLTGSLNSAWALHLVLTMGLIVLTLRFHPRSYARAFSAG